MITLSRFKIVDIVGIVLVTLCDVLLTSEVSVMYVSTHGSPLKEKVGPVKQSNSSNC